MLFTVLSFLVNNIKSIPYLIFLGMIAWIATTLSEVQESIHDMKTEIAVMSETVRMHMFYDGPANPIPTFILPPYKPKM
jgi:ABC-type methionine transport system permease subunit